MYLRSVTAHESVENIGSPATIVAATSSTYAVVQTTAIESQLFSPTTKEILEEIGAASGPSEVCSGSSVAVKRSMFKSLGKPRAIVSRSAVVPVVKIRPMHARVELCPATETAPKNAKEDDHAFGVESPIKKCKNKEKEFLNFWCCYVF